MAAATTTRSSALATKKTGSRELRHVMFSIQHRYDYFLTAVVVVVVLGRESPGVWERRHLEYSRRINTRQLGGGEPTSSSAPLDAAVLARTQQESDRESTDVAQLEQILHVSRTEFDAMHSSLDDVLQRSLAE